MTEIRANLEAEECVLGAALLDRRAVEVALADLRPSDFYAPKNAHVFDAMVSLYEAGTRVDGATVADVLRQRGVHDEIGGAAYLIQIQANVPSPAGIAQYTAIVRRESSARALLWAASEARSALQDDLQDPLSVAETLAGRLASLDGAGRLPERFWRSWDDYSADPPAAVSQPLIEGLCDVGTRTIILAGEKAGKSWLLRQLAFCAAAGVHPFNFGPIEPVRVLVLDAENPDAELYLAGIEVAKVLDQRPHAQPIRPALLSYPYGADLRSRRDRSEVEAVLEDFKPQLVIGGPVYKLMPRGEREDIDGHTAALHRILDGFRRRWGVALILEHHAPTGMPGKNRELRSKGGQQWAAWPEVTVSLRSKVENGVISAEVTYPHPPRGRFRWPLRFDRATRPSEWPWMPILRNADRAPAAAAEPLPLVDEPF